MALLPQLTRRLGQPLFLPAHGRGAALPDGLRQLLRRRAGVWDLPELPALGGPLEADGAIADSQRSAAAAMGVARCWYGVNGATGLLQAALLAMVRPGERVLLPRNVHRSLIQACVLGDLRPVLFDLPFQSDRGQPAPADSAWIERVLQALPRDGAPLRAAVLVHPTYQGYANDPTAVIQRLQQQGCCVLVDEAHGCHFAAGVDHPLPPSSLHCGADLVVHSLQKSAAALAQTAVLWLQGERLDPVRVERSLGLLQTTSPSALLLASCEEALQHWQRRKGRRQLLERLQEAEALADGLRNRGVPLLNNQDRCAWSCTQAGRESLVWMPTIGSCPEGWWANCRNQPASPSAWGSHATAAWVARSESAGKSCCGASPIALPCRRSKPHRCHWLPPPTRHPPRPGRLNVTRCR